MIDEWIFQLVTPIYRTQTRPDNRQTKTNFNIFIDIFAREAILYL